MKSLSLSLLEIGEYFFKFLFLFSIGLFCLSLLSDMDSPQAYSPNMLPAKDCKFDKDVTLVGLPPPTLWPPADDLVFAALCEQDDYWMFLRDTQDDRKMELYEAYGIVLSALLSKMC